MCGRYAAAADPADLVLTFEVVQDHTADPGPSLLKSPQDPPPGAPDYNVAPTKQEPVVLTRPDRSGAAPAEPVRQLRLLTWGLVPSWSKDPGGGVRMINARADSVLAKPAFKKAALTRRCLVPALGWYEWQQSPTATDAKGRPRRQPFFVGRADGATLAMAGLYEFWRDPGVADPDDPDAWLTTYAVVTTDAEPGLDRIHDRQPLVLEPALWDRWLDPSLTEAGEVAEMLSYAEPGRFTAHPVSTAVSATRNNGPALVEPAPVESLVGVVDPMTGEILGAGA